MTTLHAHLFDAYPAGAGMAVWFVDRNGDAHCVFDTLEPAFYVSGPREELRAVCQFLKSTRAPVRLRRTERHDAFLGRDLEVLQVGVRVPARFGAVFRATTAFRPGLTYYDGDISIPQFYAFERGVFPLADCEVDADDSGRLRGLRALDSPWDLDYDLPPLTVLTLRLGGELRDPNHSSRTDRTAAARTPLVLQAGGRVYAFDRQRPRELLSGVKHVLETHDPDLLVSAWGDSFIVPRLLALSAHYGIPLPLNRDPRRGPAHRPARSYFSYGRVIYKAEQHLLFGRWHIDRENAFLTEDYGLEGVFELARITQLPVQQVARVSTGTGISAMEVATAYRRGVLVPWQKREPEALKTALDLMQSDKGGLVYQPIVGLHEHVAELDFSSMYPSIMANFNLSPETVGCRCCAADAAARVPEIGYPVCRNRIGLVPETLRPLVAKRAEYKRRIRAMPEGERRETYRRRYSAQKWLLVTCFGYLGYKNARFGKIEAHEAVTAYGRDVLLQAKEIVEARGFRLLHAYVDALWIHRPGPRPDYDALIAEIEAQTGIGIVLEGVYRWLAFLPSRADPRQSVANRYFGTFESGETKMRGIEARRRDTVPFVRAAQVRLIEMLSAAQNAAEFRERVGEALAFAREKLGELRAGGVPLRDLVSTNRLSRAPEEFKVNTVNARVARQMAAHGIPLSPGESIRYVLVRGPERVRAWELVPTRCGGSDPHPPAPSPCTGEGEKSPRYDVERYTELFLRAVETVLTPAGVSRAMLDLWLHGNAGYLAPPGRLPPPHADPAAPLFGAPRSSGDWLTEHAQASREAYN